MTLQAHAAGRTVAWVFLAMSASQDLSNAIADNAASAASVSSAAGSQSSHSLESQIAADRYLASKRAAKAGIPGLRIFRREGNTSG